MSGRKLEPLFSDVLTDWNGLLLQKKARDFVDIDCVVRVCVQGNGGTEAIYFKVVKVKDGTFWGEALDTYRMDDYVGLDTGKTFTFRKEAISEIPISWQPKKKQKEFSRFLSTQQKGRAITGV